MMEKSILNQLFRIKYGNRATESDFENHIPNWGENFSTLFLEMKERGHLHLRIEALYEKSEKPKDVEILLDESIFVFRELERLRFSEKIESIAAQQAMMMMYGIKICYNLVPFITEEQDVSKFFDLHLLLHRIIEALNVTFSDEKYNFWKSYSFKIGLSSLALALRIEETRNPLIRINKDCQVLYTTINSWGFSPISFIANSIIGSKSVNGYLDEVLQEKIKSIIEENKK